MSRELTTQDTDAEAILNKKRDPRQVLESAESFEIVQDYGDHFGPAGLYRLAGENGLKYIFEKSHNSYPGQHSTDYCVRTMVLLDPEEGFDNMVLLNEEFYQDENEFGHMDVEHFDLTMDKLSEMGEPEMPGYLKKLIKTGIKRAEEDFQKIKIE